MIKWQKLVKNNKFNKIKEVLEKSLNKCYHKIQRREKKQKKVNKKNKGEKDYGNDKTHKYDKTTHTHTHTLHPI